MISTILTTWIMITASNFKDPVSHEFMILMFRYKDEEMCKRVPVTCHVDLTARPQTVTRDQNKT